MMCSALSTATVFAQQKHPSLSDGNAIYQQYLDQPSVEKSVLGPNGMPIDTLRNFAVGQLIDAAFFADAENNDPNQGWVHGTNNFQDVAKATRLSLSSTSMTGSLSQVLVTFSFRSATSTLNTYDIEIYEVNSATGGPGAVIASQRYLVSGLDAVDESPSTPSLRFFHEFDPAVSVPSEFFVAVNFGTYSASEYNDLAIASTDALGRVVDEDWELINNGTWVNMSDSWFIDTVEEGWYLGLEALVEEQQVGGEDTIAPDLIHSNAGPVIPEGQDLTITADISDASGVASAVMVFIPGGRSFSELTTVFLENTGGSTYEAVIPASAIDTRGLRYAIAASDAFGNTSVTDDINVRVRSEQGLDKDIVVSGIEQNVYRLVSTPIDLDSSSPANVLEDDLGEYNTEDWRFFGLNANQSYDEFPGAGAMVPGAAFWLAVSAPGQSFNTGPGTSVLTDDSFPITLNPGWTFVGTPFNFPVAQVQLSRASGEALDIRQFQGDWSEKTGPLQPFEGYAVFAVEGDQLLVDPFPPSAAAKWAPAAALKAEKDEAFAWAVGIEARGGKARDTDNVLAVSELAAIGYDSMDRPEPPIIGDYISVYFPHDDWEVPSSRFNVDVRPTFDASESWFFEVQTNVDEPVTLAFTGVESVPEQFEVVLFDRLLHQNIDLRETNTYQIRGAETGFDERFELLIGTPDAVDDMQPQLSDVPDRVSVESFPNPFYTFTTLEYGLPSLMPVTIHVYNLLGKRVTTLVENAPRDAGMHAVQWDGTDRAGNPVASGVYVFTVQAGPRQETRKVVVLR